MHHVLISAQPCTARQGQIAASILGFSRYMAGVNAVRDGHTFPVHGKAAAEGFVSALKAAGITARIA